MANKNDNLVVAYYQNEAAAEEAAHALKLWDNEDFDIKLGAIGLITIDKGSGELHVKEIGQRDSRKGALWGTAIGAAAGILTAGIALIPGMIIGAALGAGAGALNHKSLGMSDEDHARLVDHLRHGGAALGVMADDHEITATMAEMTRNGGTVEQYDMTDDVKELITKTADVQSDAASTIDSAVDAVTDTVDDVADAGVAAVAAVAAATGLSAVNSQKVYDAGVGTTGDFLAMAATPKGRAALAKETGMDEADVLNAAKRLDLMRVPGVGVKYSALLLASGVDTVVELATRNAANLATKMAEVNATTNLVAELPSEEEVAGWVASANDLPRVIEY